MCRHVNFVSVADALDLTPERVLELVRHSFTAAFISDEQRAAYMQQAQEVFNQVMAKM